MTELEQVLMRRDGLSLTEARAYIKEAVETLPEYDDFEDFMADQFGLEPDYIFDLPIF